MDKKYPPEPSSNAAVSSDENDHLLKLLARAALRDGAAFQSLYELTAPRLLAVTRRVLGDSALAEDALQEAFIQIWHKAGEYHADRGRVMTWLSTIARYRAIDIARQKRPTKTATPQDEPHDPTTEPDTLVSQLDDAGTLRRCMQRLSRSQQISIRLAFIDGLTHAQLARRLGSPIGTVKSRIRRGLMGLKECIEL